MRFNFYLTIVSLLFQNSIYAQTTIEVAENTFKVAAFSEEIFYYGFSSGDQIVFNFEEINGKELKEVEILEYPSSSKFMDYKTKKIVNKIISIPKTGVYKFRLSNAAMSGRVCRVKISRIPESEKSVNFNCSVYWRTPTDTIYTTVQEKYLIKKEYKVETLIPYSEFYVNSGSNATIKGGKSRITIPVRLPPETKEWYYVFSASREKQDLENTKSLFSLTGQLSKLIDQTGALSFGIDMLTVPPGSNFCDVYLIDFNNSRLFEAKQPFKLFTQGSRENIKSGVIKMSGGSGLTYYIGIKNPDSLYGVNVSIEVVAIIENEEWGKKDITKITTIKRDEPYLIN